MVMLAMEIKAVFGWEDVALFFICKTQREAFGAYDSRYAVSA
jgi:hypothetical protein